MSEEYLNTEEAAQFLKKSPPALRNLVYRRAIPYRKPGGRLMFIRSELERWIVEAPGMRVDDIAR